MEKGELLLLVESEALINDFAPPSGTRWRPPSWDKKGGPLKRWVLRYDRLFCSGGAYVHLSCKCLLQGHIFDSKVLGMSSFLWFCHPIHPKTQGRQGQGRKEGRILDDVQGGALCT